jgi:hypothetical protein
MATEVLELSVKTNIGQSITSLKELKDAIKAAKDEQIAMANKFGATSQEAINASKNLAELKNKVDSLNDSSKSLKGSGFEMLKQGFGQIREGLMNLDFDKVKIGLTGMGAGFTSMAKTAKAAFTGIKGAIAATGIGLLVIALGTIYAYWDDIKGVVSGLTTEQKRLNAEAEKNVKIAQDNLALISEQENILKLQGKSEKEILNMKIAATAEAIKETKIKLHQQKATRDAQIDAAKRNKAILEGFITFIQAPIVLLLKGIDSAGKAFGEDFGLAKGFTGSIAGLLFDPEKVATDVDSSIAESEKGLRALENASAGHKLAINNINKEANKKDIDGTKETVDKKKQLLEDFAKTQKTAEENELQAIKDKYKDVLAAEIEGSESKKQLLENEQAELKVITDKYEAERRIKTEEELKSLVELQNENTLNLIDDLQERALAELKIQEEKELASIKGMENFEAMKVEIDKKYSKLRGDIGKEADQKEKDRKKALQSFNVGMAQQGLQVIADAAGEGTALAKAAAIAQATISGVQGVQNAFTSANANVALTASTAGAYPITMAALAGVFAAVNIAKIASGSPASASGGGGGATAAATTPAPQMMSGAFELGGGVKPEPMKAFVVTDEMSNSQSQLANIRRRATI